MHTIRLLLATVLIAAAAVPAEAAGQARAQTAQRDSISAFGSLVASLSEPSGYFDTDNLISNESSYLHVLGPLRRQRVENGAYIGVGPDQNFSYIAAVRPRIAFIVDIRRDNLLQHLMFKALFGAARNRAEYLALWLGRPVPQGTRWTSAALPEIVAYIDSVRVTSSSRDHALNLVRKAVDQFGIELNDADRKTIERFHGTFIDAGLSLQFNSSGRAPRPYYPTLRQLLMERDLDGNFGNYLARESDFVFLRDMQRRNMIVPVVGNLAGPSALPAVSTYLRARRIPVAAMYVSNVEDYLLRSGTFERYARTVQSLPREPGSMIIRSFFGGPGAHPMSVDGHYSTQLMQRLDDFVRIAPTVRYYRDLVFLR